MRPSASGVGGATMPLALRVRLSCLTNRRTAASGGGRAPSATAPPGDPGCFSASSLRACSCDEDTSEKGKRNLDV